MFRALCKAILKRDYGLKLSLADNRLTPFIPVRANYVRWIQGLLDTTSPSYTDEYDPERMVTGIDIGTGSSAIYALLACRMRPTWKIVGTDIDVVSLANAAHNVSLNDLEGRIKLLETSSNDKLIPLDKMGLERADFVICNPPFYASTAEMQGSLTGSGKSHPPSTICTGSENEMVTQGGDLGFVTRMLEESKALGEKVQWYSAMMGKLESIGGIVEKLKERNCTNWATHFLTSEGGRTRRWAIAWSWADLRPPDGLARAQFLKKDLLPFPNEYLIQHSLSIEVITLALNEAISAIDVRWRWDEERLAGLALISGDVWSRQARRMREKKPKLYAEMLQSTSQKSPQLVLKITVAFDRVTARWMKGDDQVLFESFCGMLKRKLDEKG